MGFFDRFKRRKQPPAPEPTERPTLIVALTAPLKPDPDAIAASLAAIEPLRLPPKLTFDVVENDVLHGRAEFDSHVVRIAGFDVPVPRDIMERTVECSAWQGPAREALLNHKAHVILFHEAGGASVAERMIALYKLAAVLGGDSLSGVIHESGWTCVSAELAKAFTQPDELKSFRDALPPVVFFGVLPFHEDDAAWVVTKGCHLFAVPDLVIERAGAGNTELFELLHGIFLYTVGGARIAAGHTMQAGEDLFLRFEALDPDHKYFEYLKGTDETLLLTRISKDEVNTASRK